MSNIEILSTDHVQWSTIIVLHVLVVKALTLAVHQALKNILKSIKDIYTLAVHQALKYI